MTDKFKKVAGGSYGVYKKEKKSAAEIIGNILGGIFVAFIAFAILGALVG